VAQYLLTYLQRIGDDYLRWAVCDDRSKSVSAHDHGSFADAAKAAERRRVVMVVAGTELLLEEAAVPVSNLSKALKAIPYALEDQLAQDVETSHFAFGAKLPNGKIPVAVMAMEGLDWLLDRCEQAGLSVAEIIPEPYALPLEDGRITVMTNSGHASVRQSPGKGFSCDSDMLGLLLDNSVDSEALTDDDADAAPEKTASPEEMIWGALHFACGPDRYELRTAEGPVPMRTEVELFSRGLAQARAKNKKNPYINLLQGEYSKTEAIGKAWKPWRVPAALAATLVALWGGATFLQYQALGKQQEELQQQMSAVLKDTFPGVRNPQSDPVRQMKSRIKALAGSAGAIDDGSFIVMMSAVGSALREVENPVVKSMNYRSGKLDIELETASLQDIDKIKSKLEVDKKLVADVRSANKDNDRIKARMRVEATS
jgi:general secretion pathway protein L